MDDRDRLRYVRKGIDAPTAEQQNLIVSILKNRNKVLPYRKNEDDVRVTSGTAYKCYAIDTIKSEKRGRLSYSLETIDAPNSDDYEVVIVSGVKGWANFGFRPILAEIDYSSAPDIGECVGPKHGQNELQRFEPGFRYLGPSSVSHIGWVIRDRGIATGEGSIITSSGQTGTPTYFELESVTFSSGFNGWDGTSDL